MAVMRGISTRARNVLAADRPCRKFRELVQFCQAGESPCGSRVPGHMMFCRDCRHMDSVDSVPLAGLFDCWRLCLPFAGTICLVSAPYPALQSRKSRVAQITAFRPPGDLVVMARAAKFSIFDVSHHYIVCTGAHFESDLGVTYRTIETDAMKPVREDHRTHAGFFRPFVHYHITIFRQRVRWRKQREQETYACRHQQVPAVTIPIRYQGHTSHILMLLYGQDHR